MDQANPSRLEHGYTTDTSYPQFLTHNESTSHDFSAVAVRGLYLQRPEQFLNDAVVMFVLEVAFLT
jgi:hypothetical protein